MRSIDVGKSLVRLLLISMASACAMAPAANVSRRAATPPLMLPTPLVTALFDSRFTLLRSSPAYAVEALPPGFPSSLVPAGPVRIIGGLTTADEVVAIFADSTRRLAAVFEETFERAGFTRPPVSRGQGFSQGSGTSSTFCQDSATVSAEPLARTNGGFTRVAYRRLRGGVTCAGRAQEPQSDPRPLELPELVPMAGTRVVGSRGGRSSDGVDSEAEVTGASLVPSTMLAHYAAQLVAARWIAAAPAVSERVAAQVFEAKDDAGVLWEGVLTAVGTDRALRLSLQMRPRKATP